MPELQKRRKTGRYTLSDLLQSGEYWAGIADADKAHIASDGEAICGIIFSRNNQKQSKHEGAFKRKDPAKRKPWKRWLGIEEIPHEYTLCGACLNSRLGKNPEEETIQDVVNDIRALTGIEGESQRLTKPELQQLRSVLEGVE
jgi:hypothetical protein